MSMDTCRWYVDTGPRDSDTVWLTNGRTFLGTDGSEAAVEELQRLADRLNGGKGMVETVEKRGRLLDAICRDLDYLTDHWFEMSDAEKRVRVQDVHGLAIHEPDDFRTEVTPR